MSGIYYDESGMVLQRTLGAIAAQNYAAEMSGTPSYMLKPRLFIDGNQWCALLGENVHDGVAGFGDSPELAYRAFDEAWRECLPKVEPVEGDE